MNILITGGASGLGEAITKRLASNGENCVYFTYNNSSSNANNIENSFPNTTGIPCNFQKSFEIETILNFIESTKLDVLVNNAFSASITQEYFHKIDISVFENNFKYSILPVIQITQKAIEFFRKQKFGKIISVLSAYVINTPPKGLSEYVAAKNYLASLCKSWAIENASFNITSNCISPSFMRTHLNCDIDERVIEGIIESNPLKKLLTIDEVAESVNFFTTCSQQINGINHIINSAVNVV